MFICLIIFIDLYTLLFYVINMNVSEFIHIFILLVLATLNLCCIDLLYWFEWTNIIYLFLNKIKTCLRV